LFAKKTPDAGEEKFVIEKMPKWKEEARGKSWSLRNYPKGKWNHSALLGGMERRRDYVAGLCHAAQ